MAARTGFLGNSTKRSIIGGDLNLPQIDWKGIAEGGSVAQAFINRLVWDNGYTQVVGKPTGGVCYWTFTSPRPESALISCGTIQGISDHCEVLLDVEWAEKGFVTQEKRLVSAYHKTNVLGLQQFLRDKLPTWANNGSCVEEIWEYFKDIVFEGIERCVPHKILKPNPDPEYNKEVKRLKVKVRRAYKRRNLCDHFQAELKRLSKKLLTAKRNAQETFLSSVLRNEGKSLSEIYRFVNRFKGNKENIPAMKDCNGGQITDPVDKASNLNNYYSSVFSCEREIPDLNSTHSDKPFNITIIIIRKRLAMIGRNKSVEPDGIPSAILKLRGEDMIPYLVRLLDVTINSGTIPRDWKKAIVFPIHKGGDRSVVKNYRPASLTSVVCKQMEHAIAGYIRQVWEDRDWLYKGQHGLRPGYSCESQIITVCQDISDSIHEATRLDAIIIDFSKALDLVPHDRLLKICSLGCGFKGGRMD